MRCIRINSGQQRVAVQAIGKANTIRSLTSFRQSHEPTANEIMHRHNQIQQMLSDDSVGVERQGGLVHHGVEDVFNAKPKLAEIGTQEQYSQYIDSIYPSSTTGLLFKGLRKKGKGHNTPNHSWYSSEYWISDRHYNDGTGVRIFVADTRSLVEHELNTPDGVTTAKQQEEDFINNSYHDAIMLDTEDIGGRQIQYAIRKDIKLHEIGTEQDIEEFKEFVQKDNSSEINSSVSDDIDDNRDNQNIVFQKTSQKRLNQVQELFDANPELANEVYSAIGLNTINESEITYTDEEGNPCAKMGLTNATKGTGWKIVKDFKGKPKHSQGGVDITISDKGVSMRRGGKDIKAKFGLLIPNNN